MVSFQFHWKLASHHISIQQMHTFQFGGKFLCSSQNLLRNSSITDTQNLLIRFVILFGKVSHYFRYITSSSVHAQYRVVSHSFFWWRGRANACTSVRKWGANWQTAINATKSKGRCKPKVAGKTSNSQCNVYSIWTCKVSLFEKCVSEQMQRLYQNR